MRFKIPAFPFLQLFFVCIYLLPALLAAQTAGAPDWAKRGGGWPKVASVGGGGNWRTDVATDKHGNVYVLDQSVGKINIDGHIAAPDSSGVGTLASWDCNGVFRWMKVFGRAGGGAVSASYLVTDTAEGVYIAGRFVNINAADSVYFDADTSFAGVSNGIYIAKYSSSGNLQWVKTPAGLQSTGGATRADIMGLSASAGGGVYWYAYLSAGIYDNGAFSVTGNRYCAVEYDASGQFQSNTVLAITTTNGPYIGGYYIQFLRHGASGRFYVTGTYNQTLYGTLTIGSTSVTASGTAPCAYAAAFTAAGAAVWVKQGSATPSNSLVKSATDRDGNLYLLGIGNEGATFNGDTVVRDPNYTLNSLPFAAAMDSAGNRLWFNCAQANGNHPTITDITCSNGSVFLAGAYNTPFVWDSIGFSYPSVPGRYDIYICKIDAATGKAVAKDSISSDMFSPKIATDKNGNLFVGGTFMNQLRFGGDTIGKIDTASTGSNWFIAKYKNVNCNCDLLQPEFTATPSGVSGFSFSYNGQTPYSSITWDFGDGATLASNPSPSHTYTASGNYPVCVTVVNGCGSNTVCHWVNVSLSNPVSDMQDLNGLVLYPNPANDAVFFEKAGQGTVADVYNLQGQHLMRKMLHGAYDRMDMSSLQRGVYLFRFTDKEGKQASCNVVKE